MIRRLYAAARDAITARVQAEVDRITDYWACMGDEDE